MRYIEKILIVIILSFSGGSFAAEFYEGGTLSDKNALIWQDATLANKIATSSDFVATMFQKNILISSMASTIKSVNDLAPYAIQLAICIDESTKKEANEEQNRKIYTNQKISSMAVLCASLMGWVQ